MARNQLRVYFSEILFCGKLFIFNVWHYLNVKINKDSLSVYKQYGNNMGFVHYHHIVNRAVLDKLGRVKHNT